jgi:dehydrogenase/reductase SDR family protein 7
VVWITGASSGIGAQLARDLARHGAQVIISARREAELQRVADSCGDVPIRPYVLPLDVTDYEAQEAAYKEILEEFGRVDILVLNAGRTQRSLAEKFPLSATRELFELNVMSVINLARLVVTDMITSQRGQIVVTSSLAGKIGGPIQSSYSATKYALHGYFDALRAEVAQFNISVLLVCAGPVVSDIAENALRDPNTPIVPEKNKLPTERCTSLMVRAMYNRDYIQEIWISKHPLLLFAYLNVYFPWISRQILTKAFGPGRRRALVSGDSVYDLKVSRSFHIVMYHHSSI